MNRIHTVTCILLVFSVIVLLSSCNTEETEEESTVNLLERPQHGNTSEGLNLYRAYCGECHGTDAKGGP